MQTLNKPTGQNFCLLSFFPFFGNIFGPPLFIFLPRDLLFDINSNTQVLSISIYMIIKLMLALSNKRQLELIQNNLFNIKKNIFIKKDKY